MQAVCLQMDGSRTYQQEQAAHVMQASQAAHLDQLVAEDGGAQRVHELAQLVPLACLWGRIK